MAFETLKQALASEYLNKRKFQRDEPLRNLELDTRRLNLDILRKSAQSEEERQQMFQRLGELFVEASSLPISEFEQKYQLKPEEKQKILKLQKEGKEKEIGAFKLKKVLQKNPDVVSFLAQNEQLQPVLKTAMPELFQQDVSGVDAESLSRLPNALELAKEKHKMKMEELEKTAQVYIKQIREEYKQRRLTNTEQNKLRLNRDFYKANLDFVKNIQKGDIKKAVNAYNAQLDVWKKMLKSQIMTPAEAQAFLLNLQDSIGIVTDLFKDKGWIFDSDTPASKNIQKLIGEAKDAETPEEAIDKMKQVIKLFSTIKDIPAPPAPAKPSGGTIPQGSGDSAVKKNFIEMFNNIAKSPGNFVKDVIKPEKKKKKLSGEIVNIGGKAVFMTSDGKKINLNIGYEEAKTLDKAELLKLIKSKL